MLEAPLRLMVFCGALALLTLASPADERAPAAPGGELLVNHAFADWEDDTLVGWTLSVGIDSDWSIRQPERVPAREPDNRWIRMPDPGEEYAVLAQPLPADAIRPGNTLRFSARVKADRAYQLSIIVAFDRPQGPQKVREEARGGGAWEELVWYFEVPTDARPDSFRLQFLRPPGRPGEVLVDRASVRFAQDW